MENFGPTSPALPYLKVAENIIDVEDAKNLSVQSIVFIPVQAPALFINIHFCMKKYCEPIKLYFNSDLYLSSYWHYLSSIQGKSLFKPSQNVHNNHGSPRWN